MRHCKARSFFRGTLAFALSFTLIAGQVPVAFAEGSGVNLSDDNASNYLDVDGYAALGLSVDDDMSEAGEAPYSKETASSVYTRSEVYTAANGVDNNTYIIRNGLDRLNGAGDHDTKLSNDYGQGYGAGKLWNSINSYDSDTLRDEGKYGGGTESFLSTDATVLKNEGEGFSGLYAKSVAFSNAAGTDAKQSCIAELRAYGDSHTTTVNGQTINGGVVVELMSVDEAGARSRLSTVTPSVVSGQSNQESFYYTKTGYVQSLESYFDLASGDVDGDGIDEIFAYAGCYSDDSSTGTRYAVINMFKRSAGSDDWKTYEVKVSAGAASDYVQNTGAGSYGEKDMTSSPVVTLATGDIDRNGKDDVAITVSAPYGKKNVSTARCELFTWVDSSASLAHVDGIETETGGAISLAGANGKAMVSANCTFGTFMAYDEDGIATSTTVEGLIIAGYESLGSTYEYTSSTYFSQAAYHFVYYDYVTGEFVVSDYLTSPLSSDGNLIVKSAAKDIDQSGRFAITLAPLALATANLYGAGAETENDAVLVAGDIYNGFVCSTRSRRPGLNEPTGHMSLCSEHYNANDRFDQKGVEHIWIGDVEGGCVNDSDSFNESFLAVLGFHRDEDLGKNDDYYWMDLSHYTLKSTDDGYVEKTGQEQVICESNRKNSRYGTWISLCLPDIDKDGVRMTFYDQYKLYTNPQVLAILQETPFYDDLQDTYDYLVLSGTGFGKSSGSEHSSKGLSIEGKLGGAADVEVGFLFGGRVSGELVAKGGYDYQQLREITYSTSYDSHAGEGDKVVVYTMPVVNYVYQVEDESTGAKAMVELPVSLGFQTAIISVETFEEVTEGKTLSSGAPFIPVKELLTQTSGNPKSYQVGSGDTFGQGFQDEYGKVTRKYTSDGKQKVTSDAGATTTVTIESETTTEQEYQVGFDFNIEIIGGAQFFGEKAMVGLAGGFSACYTNTWSSSEGTEFTGAVDNLPEAAGNQYGFTWGLGVNTYQDNATGNTTWIVGYDVSDVKMPEAPAVKGFAVAEETSNSIKLIWDDVLDGASGYQYGIGMLGASGNDSVTEWKVVDSATTSYDWTGLASNAEYRFVMAVVNAEGTAAGIPTRTVTATTLPADMKLSIEGIDVGNAMSPLDNKTQASVSAGSPLSLYACGRVQSVIGPDGSVNDNLYYTWYKIGRNSETPSVVKREQLPSGTVSTLTIDEVGLEDDAALFYCTVSQDRYSISTGTLRLRVNAQVSKMGRRFAPRLVSLVGSSAKMFGIRDASADPVVTAKTNSGESTTPGSTSDGNGNNAGSASKTSDNQMLPFIVGGLVIVVVAAIGLLIVARRRSGK